MKFKLLFLIQFLFYTPLNAQSIEKKHLKIEIGAELEAYPTGYIPTITSNIFLSPEWALRLRLGANFPAPGSTKLIPLSLKKYIIAHLVFLRRFPPLGSTELIPYFIC